MKHLANKMLALLLLTVVFAACKKDEQRAYLNVSGAMTLTSNQTVMVLTEANAANPGITFTWNKANFGFKSANEYTLQMCKAGTNWAVPATTNNVAMGTSLSIALTVGGFNTELAKFLPAFAVNDIDVRVMASPGGAAAPQYSNTVKVKVTPYRVIIPYSFPRALNVAGNYQNWDPPTAPQLVDVNGTAAGGNYEGYINFANPSPEFKLVKGNNWGAGDLGMASPGNLNPNGGNNITLGNGAGIYLMRANRTTNTYSATKINSWGIIGSATPGGWGVETPMTYDPITKLYSITVNLVAATSGSPNELKFRANNDWGINFGITNSKLEYNGPNVPITVSGNYTITLDLLIAGNYDYLIKKN